MHLIKNKFKILLRRKEMIFWVLIFPFILGTFFKIALGNIGEAFKLNVVPVAIVDDNNFNNNKLFKEVILSLSKDDQNKIFDAKYTNLDEAKNLLESEEIDGYISVNDNNDVNMFVKKNGINQTIIKSVLDEYLQTVNMTKQMIEFNPKVIYNGVLDKLKENKDYIVDDSKEHIDFSINYFFTLIAMACLYGSLMGIELVKDSESNLSTKAARINMAPINKFKILFSNLFVGYVIQIASLFLLFMYLIFVLKVNFGNQIIPTVILSMVGCLAGLSLGTFVGVSNKKSENFKIGLLIAVVMSCCFFSGMMGVIQIKVFFDEKFPLLSKINPVNMITDGLYSLFAYDNLNVYYDSLIRISIFSLLFIILSFVFTRRKKYDSI